MVELLGRGDLEAVHGDPLRIHAAHHVADRPVLPRGIESLQDHQNAPGVLGGEPRLILGHELDALLEQGNAFLLLPLDACLEGGVEILGQLHLGAWLHPQLPDEFLKPLAALV